MSDIAEARNEAVVRLAEVEPGATKAALYALLNLFDQQQEALEELAHATHTLAWTAQDES
jgi:hypothetical protein